MKFTKKISLFFAVIFGLMFFSGATATAECNYPHNVTIQDPSEGSTTNSSIILIAKTSREGVDCAYTLDNSAVSYSMFRKPSGTIHNASISGISGGQHVIRVDCIRHTNSCTYTANASVSWNVYGDPSIPEFPSAAIPAILSIASFGIVSLKMKRNQ